MKASNNKTPLKRVLVYVFLSLLFSFILFYLALFSFHYLEEKQSINKEFEIQAIEQIGKKKESLKTEYFAELLNISQDVPKNLYLFSLEEGKEKLLSSPVIETVSLQKVFPSTLRIEYSSRVPLFILGNYTNTLVDKEGFLFPERPFYTPKNLPEIFISLPNEPETTVYGSKIESESFLLAKKCYQFLIKEFNLKPFEIKRIDTSKSFENLFGKTELVLIIEEKKQKPHLLRLPPSSFESQLKLYFALKKDKKKMIDPSCNFPLFDLRLIDLCLINCETVECGVK